MNFDLPNDIDDYVDKIRHIDRAGKTGSTHWKRKSSYL